MKKFIILVSFMTVCAVATIVVPEFLAKNTFLVGFISHEILAILAVILSITFASVANVHLSLNRIVRVVFRRDWKRGILASEPVRKEINSNAWLLFWAFIVCIGALIVKGVLGDNVYIESSMNGIALTVLLLNVLVLHDMYKTIFAIVSSPELSDGEPANETPGSRENGTTSNKKEH